MAGIVGVVGIVGIVGIAGVWFGALKGHMSLRPISVGMQSLIPTCSI
jgi:hypothetical protein